RALHQERDGAELVQREEAGVWRSSANGERRLELQHVAQIVVTAGARRGETEETQQITGLLAALQHRRRWELPDRDRGGGSAQAVEELLAHRAVELAEDEVVRFVDAD